MLSENIKSIRKSKGLTQEELAVRLHVVRQTVSKWEKGRSVPDSEMLISLSEVLETPVSAMIGEVVLPPERDEMGALSEKLERINLYLAQRKASRRRTLHWGFIALGVVVLVVFMLLVLLDSPYLLWDYSDPETAVVGVVIHAFEWLFVRLAPFILLGAAVGTMLTRRKTL
ncbi:MAG: helix-turn-helix transcriptional regulator [Clostridia bacterium]|nr:helix-turn-helix transcriptional regulator [Clostridia bacterium]